MNTIIVEKQLINIKTGDIQTFVAEVQSERDEQHKIYSLTYEGYQSAWKAKEN